MKLFIALPIIEWMRFQKSGQIDYLREVVTKRLQESQNTLYDFCLYQSIKSLIEPNDVYKEWMTRGNYFIAEIEIDDNLVNNFRVSKFSEYLIKTYKLDDTHSYQARGVKNFNDIQLTHIYVNGQKIILDDLQEIPEKPYDLSTLSEFHSTESPVEFLKHFPPELHCLLLYEIRLLTYKRESLFDYEMREPNSLANLFSGWINFILPKVQSQDMQFSLEEMNSLHAMLTGKVAHIQTMGSGRLRQYEVLNPLEISNASEEGIAEMLEEIAMKEKETGIGLISEKDLENPYVKDPEKLNKIVSEARHKGIHWQNIGKTPEERKAQAKQIYNQIKNGTRFYWIPPRPENVELLIEEQINILNEGLKNNDLRKRFSAIVKFLRQIEHIHPYSDGNGRLAYGMLNMFLFMNQLTPSMLYDPNHFAGFSQAQIESEIISGMQRARSMQENNREFLTQLYEQNERFAQEGWQMIYNPTNKKPDERMEGIRRSSDGLLQAFHAYIALKEIYDQVLKTNWNQPFYSIAPKIVVDGQTYTVPLIGKQIIELFDKAKNENISWYHAYIELLPLIDAYTKRVHGQTLKTFFLRSKESTNFANFLNAMVAKQEFLPKTVPQIKPKPALRHS